MEGLDGSWNGPGHGLGMPLSLAAASPLDGLAPVVLSLLLLLALSFLASLTEAAFLALPRLKAQTWTASERPAERLASKIRLDFSKALAAIVVVNNLANTAGPVLVGYLASEYASVQGWSHETVTGVVASLITFLVILFGEILPKTIGEYAVLEHGSVWVLQKDAKYEAGVATGLFLTIALIPAAAGLLVIYLGAGISTLARWMSNAGSADKLPNAS